LELHPPRCQPEPPYTNHMHSASLYTTPTQPAGIEDAQVPATPQNLANHGNSPPTDWCLQPLFPQMPPLTGPHPRVQGSVSMLLKLWKLSLQRMSLPMPQVFAAARSALATSRIPAAATTARAPPIAATGLAGAADAAAQGSGGAPCGRMMRSPTAGRQVPKLRRAPNPHAHSA
jgi:hypothetical protein